MYVHCSCSSNCCKELSETLQINQFHNSRQKPKLMLRQKEKLKLLEKRVARQVVKRKVKEMQEVELLVLPALLLVVLPVEPLLVGLPVVLQVVLLVEVQQEGQQGAYLEVQQVAPTENLVSRLPQY